MLNKYIFPEKKHLYNCCRYKLVIKTHKLEFKFPQFLANTQKQRHEGYLMSRINDREGF